MQALELFSLRDGHPFESFFKGEMAPWEWVGQIKKALSEFSFPETNRTDIPAGLHIEGDVYIGKNVKLPPYGSIQGPCYIDDNCELRPGVYIRGNVIVGQGSVLGNSCEYKNCLLLDNVQTPHFNYVGDSILGNKTHLGAGVIISNLRLDQKEIQVKTSEGRMGTGMRKLGALMGDGSEVGSNSALQPGTILGKKALVMPAIAFSGYLAEGILSDTRICDL